MEDKAFELLTEMYAEMTEQFKKINSKLDEKSDKRDIIRLENEHGVKLDSLMDGYKQLHEGQQEIKNEIREIKETVNIHDIKLLKVK